MYDPKTVRGNSGGVQKGGFQSLRHQQGRERISEEHAVYEVIEHSLALLHYLSHYSIRWGNF